MVFIFNSGVYRNFVKYCSDNLIGNALVYSVALLEYDLYVFIYYDRIPSLSNPADDPSHN